MKRVPTTRQANALRSMSSRLASLPFLVLSVATCGQSSVTPDGAVVFASSDVHVLGTSESLALVRDLEVLPDGSVWLLNSVEPFFVGFHANGSLIGRHGASGGGPEEFRMPAGLLTGGLNGEAWAFDYVRHAFIRVSNPDAEWSEFAIPPDVVPPGTVRGGMNIMSPTVRTARLGEEIVFPWTTGSMDSGISAFWMAILAADIAALDPRTGAVRHIVDLGDVLDDPSVGFVATDGGFPLWFRLWAVCGDHVRVYDRVRNQLRGFTASGTEVAAIELPPVRLTEVTPQQFARAVFPLRQAEVTGAVGTRLRAQDSLRVLNQIAQSLGGTPSQLAAYLPRYVDFRCSSDSGLWLHPIDLEIGALKGGPQWLRITADGAAREVLLPDGFDALRFTRERIWGIQRDEFDVASVAWIELPSRL